MMKLHEKIVKDYNWVKKWIFGVKKRNLSEVYDVFIRTKYQNSQFKHLIYDLVYCGILTGTFPRHR